MSYFNAENLTISVPGTKCNLNCPYCISKITESVEYNDLLFFRNVDKVKTVARSSNVSSVLITGKGEPTLSNALYKIILEFNTFPIELQTNGIVFENNNDKVYRILHDLVYNGLDTISISMDYIYKNPIDRINNMSRFFEYVKKMDINVRLSVNITDQADVYFHELIKICKDNNINQLIFRNITLPIYTNENRVTKWIKENTRLGLYKELYNTIMTDIIPYSKLIRTTRFGMNIWDYEGISIALSDNCIQESNNTNDIRSLIYQADGHLYTSWNSKASRIF